MGARGDATEEGSGGQKRGWILLHAPNNLQFANAPIVSRKITLIQSTKPLLYLSAFKNNETSTYSNPELN